MPSQRRAVSRAEALKAKASRRSLRSQQMAPGLQRALRVAALHSAQQSSPSNLKEHRARLMILAQLHLPLRMAIQAMGRNQMETSPAVAFTISKIQLLAWFQSQRMEHLAAKARLQRPAHLSSQLSVVKMLQPAKQQPRSASSATCSTCWKGVMSWLMTTSRCERTCSCILAVASFCGIVLA